MKLATRRISGDAMGGKSRIMSVFAFALLGVAITGCGDGRPHRVPVAGQVVIDGQPVPFGTVKFVLKDARASIGSLDREGRFQLSCYEKNDGAMTGTHQVSVHAAEGVDDRTVRWHAPKQYADKNTSGIEVTIDEPTDDLLIELTWSGGKGPFVERQ